MKSNFLYSNYLTALIKLNPIAKYYDDVSIKDILSKIYFEGYTFKDIKRYAFKAFCEINELDEFQKLLLLKIRDFCEVKIV